VPRLRWKAAGLLVATAAVLLVAACGGGGSKPASASAAGGNANGGNNAFAAYVDCLNKNGVAIALPSGGPRNRPSGFPRNRPSGGPRNGTPGGPRNAQSSGARNGTPDGPRNAQSSGARNGTPDGARTSGMPRPRPSGSAGRGFPGGGGFGGGFAKPANVDDATWQKAQQACASVRPSFGPGNRQGGGTQNAAFQNCMKDHGVTDLQNLSTTDPTVKKALDVCRVLRQSQPSATPAA
jgi:hypothetical protein